MLVVRPSGCSSSSSALRALAVITVAAALLCAAVEPAAAAAWTQYRRFANHSGFSQTLPYHHVPSVVWSHQTPGIADTSLILSADSIFFGDASGTVRAVEKSSGNSVWNFTMGGSVVATPCLLDTYVIAGSMDGTVYKIDAVHGFERWRSISESPIIASPLCTDSGTAYVVHQNGRLNAFDMRPSNPTLKWTTELSTSGPYRSAPAASGNLLIVCGAGGLISAFDLNTGSLAWNLTLNGSLWDTPAINDEKKILYVGALNSYTLYAISFSDTSATIKWTHAFAVSSSFGSITPAIDNKGNVIFGAWDTNLYCFNGDTGAQVWRYHLGEWMFSSPIVGDSTVVFGGLTTALNELNTAAISSSGDIPSGKLTLRGYVMGSPATDGDLIFIVSRDGYLYAIGNRHSSITTNTLVITAIVAGVLLIIASVVAYYCSKKYHGSPSYMTIPHSSLSTT